MSTMMTTIRLETGTRIIRPIITLEINIFSTHEIPEIHTWQPADYTAADLTTDSYQETRVKSMNLIKSY